MFDFSTRDTHVQSVHRDLDVIEMDLNSCIIGNDEYHHTLFVSFRFAFLLLYLPPDSSLVTRIDSSTSPSSWLCNGHADIAAEHSSTPSSVSKCDCSPSRCMVDHMAPKDSALEGVLQHDVRGGSSAWTHFSRPCIGLIILTRFSLLHEVLSPRPSLTKSFHRFFPGVFCVNPNTSSFFLLAHR